MTAAVILETGSVAAVRESEWASMREAYSLGRRVRDLFDSPANAIEPVESDLSGGPPL